MCVHVCATGHASQVHMEVRGHGQASVLSFHLVGHRSFLLLVYMPDYLARDLLRICLSFRLATEPLDHTLSLAFAWIPEI